MSETITDGNRSLDEACTAPPRRIWLRLAESLAKYDAYDLATLVGLAALLILAFATFGHYAISNDEVVQHRYGQLIVDYYLSGLTDKAVFHFENLYLYGGLFDVIAVLLAKISPLDTYEQRHIMCALIGVAGIGASAATARLIAGPRAGFFAGASLALCGAWYGGMFNHTKDIPLAAAMAGALYVLVRLARDLPKPRTAHVVAFGLLTGAALGIRVLALLLVIHAGVAILLNTPRPIVGHFGERARFVLQSGMALLTALAIAYLVMIVAWPWAALAPLNPIRGLLDFSEFQYNIRTLLGGQVFEMASVPRLYVPIYILIRVPHLTLGGTALALAFLALPRHWWPSGEIRRREIALVCFTAVFPLSCQVIFHGPAFTGMRHFLFVIPSIAILAGVGLHLGLKTLSRWRRDAAAGFLAVVVAWSCWNLMLLIQLHPYE